MKTIVVQVPEKEYLLFDCAFRILPGESVRLHGKFTLTNDTEDEVLHVGRRCRLTSEKL